ncbi:synaptopodin-2 isoform X1 [Anarrhichthys ocellatus]|uniref:synaptopodin-2 isoform X1 n=1 Tax=Anarrhichthys ocellatus TaxID=433405 RepID=UPI0012ECD453|nr:synaptopodin-2-like isoform X1 [Anarrhichthys ocellatus]
MGTGDYICVTLRGGAPWGFSLREGEGDTYRPFFVSQVEEGGRAFLAGVREGDEVVSLNGEPCADLTLLRAIALIDTLIDCLQLLVKRYCTIPPEESESEETYGGGRDSSGEALKSTTLHIFTPKHRSQSPRELYISESQDEAYGLGGDTEFRKGPQLLYTQLHVPSSGNGRDRDHDFQENDGEGRQCFPPGDMVELQVSLSEQTLDHVGCTALGSAHGIDGELSNKEAVDMIHTTTVSHDVPCPVRQPLGQHGVVLSSPSMLGQVEVILQQPAASGAGRGLVSVGGPRVSGSVGSHSEGEEGGGHCEAVPGSFTVSFEIASEEATPAEEHDSDSEGDQDKPNKHRARHARLRRSESLSDKQLKEAKSKCKRIALLLTAAPPNPNNKGVLMFKKHRQRAKKYTLVSYGTGEDEPEYSDEDDEENEDEKQETHAVEFTLVAPNGSEIDKHFLTNVRSSKGVLTINWDKGLLEIERNLNNQAEMECLPETKGKGAVMFAQRRLRMDEISAEHDELRRQGIPVEAVPMVENKTEEHSYMQSTTEGHADMDVNIHQQSQHQQQSQQYQEQQCYEQQQNYQQQQQQQQYQQQQYEQQHYQQQQMYQQQQQQEYHQEQQQMQQYSTNINGTVQHQTSEMQSTLSNRTAKPFSVENMPATYYSPTMSGTNQDFVGQGEQIASRDERISTPASRTGVLSDARRRNVGKPMFTFKEAPKVSPNPALLNLLNRKDKKLGFESGAEEDYLSLGAEACNFLQSQQMKHKAPPPVAPKPVINPYSPPWSPQIEVTNQDMPQQAENSVSTPAVAPTTETTPAPELEPTPAPAPEPSPPPAPQETPASTTTEEQHTWTPLEPESQPQPLQVTAQEENSDINSTLQPEPAPVPSWAPAPTQAQYQPSTSSWHPAQVQSQEPPHSQSPPQPPWMTQQPSQTQAQPQPPTNTWTPQIQPSWTQPQGQAQAQTQAQPSWTRPQGQAQAQTQAQPSWTQPQEQPQSHPQVQPPWAHSHEQPNLQQMQPTWGQPQEPMQQQPQTPWAQPSQTDSQHQTPSQAQPPWAQQDQPESQPQPPWVQPPQHQAPQQAWSQAQAPGQPQPPQAPGQPQPLWVSTQPQQQPLINEWPPSQTQAQVQPPWIQAAQAQPPAQPQAILNPWPTVPAQAQSSPSWAQHPSEHGQHPMNSWAPEQNQAQHQPVPPQLTPQPNWQQSISKTPPQPPINTWPPPPTQPQAPFNAWAPQPQQMPVNVSSSMVNTPSPKPWHLQQNAPHNRAPPPPPQRMHSLTIGQRGSPPINPMASVFNPSSQGSSFGMPSVRGKGADMFAKRQSRMEKFVVDSETVQANKTSRSTSPVASLPNEWKYTPNVRGPPSRAYNPIQSPSYPPAAIKALPPSSPLTKANKKGKEKQKPVPKLNVIDVMKHQPYQLNSSLFIFGPAAEAAKPPEPKPDCSPPNPPVENQPIRYEQMALTQPAGPLNAPYPQQAYGMPMQPMMHDGHYQQNPANIYPPSNPYQHPPAGPYQQAYNQQTYQQPAPPAYHPQAPQSPNPSYQQAPQALYQPANSPPYLTPPSVPYQPQPPSVYVAPSFPVAARPESAAGGNTGAAPKPKFTAKKSSAQVWKPAAVDKE